MNIINSVIDKITKKNKDTDINSESNIQEVKLNGIQCKNYDTNEELTIRTRTEFNPKNYSLNKQFEKMITEKFLQILQIKDN